MKKIIFTMLLLMTSVSVVNAGDYYIGVGYVNYIRDIRYSDKGITHNNELYDINLASTSLTLGYESSHKNPLVITLTHVPEYEFTVTNHGDGYYIYDKNDRIRSHNILTVGKQARHTFTNGIFIYGELGFALVDRKTPALSGTFNFYETAGIGYKKFRLSVNHKSNAGIEGRNLGEDTIMLSYHF